MARTYPVKRGVSTSPETLLEKAKEITGNGEIKNGHVICSIPGIKFIELYAEGKNLAVETENDSSSSNSMETVRTFNKLMEEITGLSSKERKKRFSKI